MELCHRDLFIAFVGRARADSMADPMVGVEDTKPENLRESRSADKEIAERPWRSIEKLVLLYAVLKHGDQAWTAVSRAMRSHFAVLYKSVFASSTHDMQQEERHQVVFSPKRCAEVHAELVDSDQKVRKQVLL